VQKQEKQPYLSNRYTNWEAFRHFFNEKLFLKVALKQKKILKQQLNTLETPNNGLATTRGLNKQTYPLPPTTLFKLKKKQQKKTPKRLAQIQNIRKQKNTQVSNTRT
jgi:hypothetical protein